MSKKEKKSEVQAKEVVEMKPLKNDKLAEQAEQIAQPESIKIMMTPPSWNVLNGSGKVCMQRITPGVGKKDVKSGLFLPGSVRLDEPTPKENRERRDVHVGKQFFVIGYDDDINIQYRKAKFAMLDIDPINMNFHELKVAIAKLKAQKGNQAHVQKSIDEELKKLQFIYNLEVGGHLDVICLGDEIHFNTEHFMPVKMTDVSNWQNDYYVIHYTDILGITKEFPRYRLEGMPRK